MVQLRKTSLQFLSFFFVFFSEYCELHLFQFKEDCIVLLTCTDTREAVCSESIDSKYKKLGEEGNLSEKLCCFAWH